MIGPCRTFCRPAFVRTPNWNTTPCIQERPPSPINFPCTKAGGTLEDVLPEAPEDGANIDETEADADPYVGAPTSQDEAAPSATATSLDSQYKGRGYGVLCYIDQPAHF